MDARKQLLFSVQQWLSNWPAWANYPFNVYANYILGRAVAGSDSASTFGGLSGTYKGAGGVLAPNGCIYGIPRDSTTVLKINPADDSVTTFGSLSESIKWVGGGSRKLRR